MEDYYGDPPGAMLPLGFPTVGHKGFGLALVVDILAGALSGGGCSQADPPQTGNALFFTVYDIAAFRGLDGFLGEVDDFIDWLKSCPPMEGFGEVMLPGENSHRIHEARRREGMEVDDTAWGQIAALAGELGVNLPDPVESA